MLAILRSHVLLIRCWAAAWLLCWASAGQAAEGARIMLVLSDGAKPYQAFAQAFRQNLSGDIRLDVVERPEDFAAATRPDLVVSVGVKAAYAVAEKTALPLLAAMIPSSRQGELQAKRASSGTIAALYLDQPWARQVALLRAVMPERKRIGVLYSAAVQPEIAALRSVLAGYGYTLVARMLQRTETFYDDLDDVLAHSDVLLAVPDASVYSGGNIRNILLSSYRRGVPLVGLSQAYVTAGALCAVYSTPEQLAAQASFAATSFIRSRRLPESAYPRMFALGVNADVA